MRNLINRIVLILAIGSFFASCEENAIPELTTPLEGDMARAKFFFHSEAAPAANFFIDEEKVTAAGSTTAGEEQGLTYTSVYPTNAFAVVPTGNVFISARDMEDNEIASTEATLNENENYSIYLVGSEDNLEIFVMEDNLPEDDEVKIYWRFVNTMADIPFTVDAYAVKAAVPATDDAPAEPAQVITLGTDVDFKEGGEYVELVPGSYTFKIFNSTEEYDPLTSTPFIEHSVNVGTLGRSYTTQIRGTYTDPLGTGKIDFWRDR